MKWMYTIRPTKKISLQTTRSNHEKRAMRGTRRGNQEFTFWYSPLSTGTALFFACTSVSCFESLGISPKSLPKTSVLLIIFPLQVD